MQIRGSLVVTKDLTLNNPGGTAPSKGLVALSDADGKVHWGHLVLLPLDQYYTYPDKGTLVTYMGRVYYSLVNRARGGSILNKYIWKEITLEQLSQDQLDAMNQADEPSYQNPIVTLGELQSNLSSLRLIGDVTGYAEYQEGVLVLRTTIPEQSTVGTSFVRDSFQYIGAQSFMLSQDVVNVFMITVNGQLLNEDQYRIEMPNKLNVIDELEAEDNIMVVYNLTAAGVTGKVDCISVEKETITEVVAAENIISFRAITATGNMANNTIASHRGKIIGFSLKQVAAGYLVSVKTSGVIKNPIWNWTAGDRIFINGNELVNYAAMTGDFSQCLGVAIDEQTIDIQIRQVIRL